MTKLALDLTLYGKETEKYRGGLREAAVKPSIYNDLIARFPEGLPSDETLRAELVADYDFNFKKVDSFISDFRETLSYAGLDKGLSGFSDEANSEKLDGVSIEKEPLEEPEGKKKKAELLDNEFSYPIPLEKKNKATIIFERLPVSERDLDRIKNWVDLMQGPLTEQEDE